MEREGIIEKIELYYQQYINQDSDTLFNIATNSFMQKIKSIPFCEYAWNMIKIKYPFSKEDIEKEQEWTYTFLAKEADNIDKIISFYLYWLEYIQEKRSKNNQLTQYYRNCYWLTTNSNITEQQKIKLFKTDFIRLILDFLILQLQEENYILYLLNRYKQRIERFNSVKESVKKDTELKELKLQKDILLYLFDQGIDIPNETNQINSLYSANIGNGEPDFIITQHNKKPFIIEVKVCKSEEDVPDIKSKAVSQLKDYMSKCSTTYGCLLIFTKEDYNFISDENLHVFTIYIGDNTSCCRKTETIKIK